MSRQGQNDCGAGIAIFLASLVLVAINAKAQTIEPKNENTRLIWTSDCPAGMPSTNGSNMCKKRIYADDSVDVSKLKWDDVEEIAKISFKGWKEKLKERFGKKQGVQ